MGICLSFDSDFSIGRFVELHFMLTNLIGFRVVQESQTIVSNNSQIETKHLCKRDYLYKIFRRRAQEDNYYP